MGSPLEDVCSWQGGEEVGGGRDEERGRTFNYSTVHCIPPK